MNIEQMDNVLGLTFDTSGSDVGKHLKFLVELEHTLQHDHVKSSRIRQALKDSSKVHLGNFTLVAYMTITMTQDVTNAIFVEDSESRDMLVVYVNEVNNNINIQFALSPTNRNKGFYAYNAYDEIEKTHTTLIIDKV